jgi:hypothetical protein
MTDDDPLERAFAALRAEADRSRGPRLPAEQLDAFLDADADPAERRRVAAAVVADRSTREQLAQLLAVDAELAATAAANGARSRFRLVASVVVALAALLLLTFLLWPLVQPVALDGRIVVAGVDDPKDPTWPSFLRARIDESLQVVGGAANAEQVHWVAVEVFGAGSWSLSGLRTAPLRLADLLRSVPNGPLLLAAGRGEVPDVTQRLRGLCTAEVQAAAASLGGAGAARELARVTTAGALPDLLLVVLEIF